MGLGLPGPQKCGYYDQTASKQNPKVLTGPGTNPWSTFLSTPIEAPETRILLTIQAHHRCLQGQKRRGPSAQGLFIGKCLDKWSKNVCMGDIILNSSPKTCMPRLDGGSLEVALARILVLPLASTKVEPIAGISG